MGETKDSAYKSCFLFSEKCGSYQRFKSPVDGLFGVEELTSEVKSHLLTLKIMCTNGNADEWSEKRLIENRSMINIPDNGKFCAYHRYTLSIMWKPQKCCKHPVVSIPIMHMKLVKKLHQQDLLQYT